MFYITLEIKYTLCLLHVCIVYVLWVRKTDRCRERQSTPQCKVEKNLQEFTWKLRYHNFKWMSKYAKSWAKEVKLERYPKIPLMQSIATGQPNPYVRIRALSWRWWQLEEGLGSGTSGCCASSFLPVLLYEHAHLVKLIQLQPCHLHTLVSWVRSRCEVKLGEQKFNRRITRLRRGSGEQTWAGTAVRPWHRAGKSSWNGSLEKFQDR